MGVCGSKVEVGFEVAPSFEEALDAWKETVKWSCNCRLLVLTSRLGRDSLSQLQDLHLLCQPNDHRVCP